MNEVVLRPSLSENILYASARAKRALPNIWYVPEFPPSMPRSFQGTWENAFLAVDLVIYLIARAILGLTLFPLAAVAHRFCEEVKRESPVSQPIPTDNWLAPAEERQRVYGLVATQVETVLLRDLALIVSEYLNPVPGYWYHALEKINALPESIPPLPDNMRAVLEGPQGTDYTVMLIPEEFGNLEQLERRMIDWMDAKGINNYRFFQFRDFDPVIREAYGSRPFGQTHWVLMRKGILPGSRDQLASQQMRQIEQLKRETGVNYQLPSLTDLIAALFLYRLSGNWFLLSGDNESHRITHTLVRETISHEGKTYNIRVGGAWNQRGLEIQRMAFDAIDPDVGVTVTLLQE